MFGFGGPRGQLNGSVGTAKTRSGNKALERHGADGNLTSAAFFFGPSRTKRTRPLTFVSTDWLRRLGLVFNGS